MRPPAVDFAKDEPEAEAGKGCPKDYTAKLDQEEANNMTMETKGVERAQRLRPKLVPT